MRKSIGYILGAFILVAILINTTLKNPNFNDLSAKAAFELQASQPEDAEVTLKEIIDQDSLNLDRHYQYISNHFNIPEKKKEGKHSYKYRDDQTIQYYYTSLGNAANSQVSDIGFYGKGLIAIFLEKYFLAITEFQNVKNKKIKFLNNSLGYAYKSLDSLDQAEFYFREEIKNKGNLEAAYSNLVQVLFEKGKTSEINTILNNKALKKYFPPRIERALYFKSYQPIKYVLTLFNSVFSGFNIYGFIAAFLIMVSWIVYLRKIDIYEEEKWRHVILVVFLGMFFCFLTFPLSDFNNYILKFNLNENLINDFIYSVIGIGAIEEFVKIIPLLIILRYTKIVNEPFDYIVYASLSALGFAFIENLIYFDENNLHIIHGRALTSVVSHMFDSSIIAYGLILNKYKRQKNPYLNFLFFFALAALAHGFYDFWLINKTASTFSIFTVFFMLISMYMWNSFINNALNQSAFYDKDISINHEKLQDYLLYSLAGVVLFEYIALALKFSPSVANNGLFDSLVSGTYLIAFLSVNLGKFNLDKGVWAPIKYWGNEEEKNYDKIVDSEIKLDYFSNRYLNDYLPNTGTIMKRLTVSNEPDWYLIKLNRAPQSDEYSDDTVIIRTKDKEEQIEKDKKKIVAFYKIPNNTNLETHELKQTDLKFCGWALVN
jgi:RsiW-degrading membrane proteinase PrsW (M82 family)